MIRKNKLIFREENKRVWWSKFITLQKMHKNKIMHEKFYFHRKESLRNKLTASIINALCILWRDEIRSLDDPPRDTYIDNIR